MPARRGSSKLPPPAGLLEAEVVTADGQVLVANACQHPELFWGLKGGGGGSLGVVTRMTLRTRELPNYFGAVNTGIKATSDDAFRALIAKMVSFYASELFNPHWGEQIAIRTGNELRLRLMFQGVTAGEATAVFKPFFDWVRARPEYSFTEQTLILDVPGKSLWDAEYFRQHVPGAMLDDSRPGARPEHVLWEGDHDQVGWYIHNYKSAWLPASPDRLHPKGGRRPRVLRLSAGRRRVPAVSSAAGAHLRQGMRK